MDRQRIEAHTHYTSNITNLFYWTLGGRWVIGLSKHYRNDRVTYTCYTSILKATIYELQHWPQHPYTLSSTHLVLHCSVLAPHSQWAGLQWTTHACTCVHAYLYPNNQAFPLNPLRDHWVCCADWQGVSIIHIVHCNMSTHQQHNAHHYCMCCYGIQNNCASCEQIVDLYRATTQL